MTLRSPKRQGNEPSKERLHQSRCEPQRVPYEHAAEPLKCFAKILVAVTGISRRVLLSGAERDVTYRDCDGSEYEVTAGSIIARTDLAEIKK
jgi:hypothetical protein